MLLYKNGAFTGSTDNFEIPNDLLGIKNYMQPKHVKDTACHHVWRRPVQTVSEFFPKKCQSAATIPLTHSAKMVWPSLRLANYGVTAVSSHKTADINLKVAIVL